MGLLHFIKVLTEKAAQPITVNYPSKLEPVKAYSQIPASLRGVPERDEEKCIGCGSCTSMCCGRATFYEDVNGERLVKLFIPRCTFCYHCVEICPQEALNPSTKFELLLRDKEGEEAYAIVSHKMIACENCGAFYAPEKLVDEAIKRCLENIDSSIREHVKRDLERAKKLCTNCRKALSANLDIHTKKYVWLEVKP